MQTRGGTIGAREDHAKGWEHRILIKKRGIILKRIEIQNDSQHDFLDSELSSKVE